MKKIYFPLIFLFCLGAVLPAEAKIRTKTFETAAPMTQGQLFLNQVDTVSLYLSTEDIVYVPRLSEDKELVLNITFLANKYRTNEQAVESFGKRHVRAFTNALEERMRIYTPALAKEFDPQKDLIFNILVGPEGRSVARVEGNKWYWVKVTKEAPRTTELATEVVRRVVRKQGKQGDNCDKDCPCFFDRKKNLAKAEKLKGEAKSVEDKEWKKNIERKPPVTKKEESWSAPSRVEEKKEEKNKSKKITDFENNSSLQKL